MPALPFLAALAAVTLAGDVVRVGDVATTADDVRALPVLRLPPGTDAVTLTPDAVRNLVNNRLPGMTFALRHAASARFVRSKVPATPRTGCLRTRIEIAADTRIADDMVERGSCDGAVARLRYDRMLRAAVARQDIPAGTNLGHARALTAAPVLAGQPLILRTATGPVVIERQVTALQPARAGARLFARTDDGVAITSRLAVAEPELAR